MRVLLKVKLLILIALWSVICLGFYLVIAAGEGALEFGAGLGGTPMGRQDDIAGWIDLAGDVVQWGVGLLWLAGVLVLWYLKRLLTSRQTRANAANMAMRTAKSAAPYVIARHPLGRAANAVGGNGVKFLAGVIARKMGKR